MKDIDFLPHDFREQTARRRGGAWRLLAALALLLVLGGVDIRMRVVSHQARGELRQLEQPYQAAQETRTRLATAQSELDRAEEQANLMAYLQHRWPISQLLAIPISTTPDAIRLDQIRLEHRPSDNPSPASSAAGNLELQEVDPTTLSPAVLALQELQELSAVELLTLSGTTSDTVAVQRFITNLSRSPLVQAANLQAITKAQAGPLSDSTQAPSQFVVQVRLVESGPMASGPSGAELTRLSRLDRLGESLP